MSNRAPCYGCGKSLGIYKKWTTCQQCFIKQIKITPFPKKNGRRFIQLLPKYHQAEKENKSYESIKQDLEVIGRFKDYLKQRMIKNGKETYIMLNRWNMDEYKHLEEKNDYWSLYQSSPDYQYIFDTIIKPTNQNSINQFGKAEKKLKMKKNEIDNAFQRYFRTFMKKVYGPTLRWLSFSIVICLGNSTLGDYWHLDHPIFGNNLVLLLEGKYKAAPQGIKQFINQAGDVYDDMTENFFVKPHSYDSIPNQDISKITLKILIGVYSQKILERNVKFFIKNSSNYPDIFNVLTNKSTGSLYLSHYESLKIEWLGLSGKTIESISNQFDVNSYITYKHLMDKWYAENDSNWDDLNYEQKLIDMRTKMRKQILALVATNGSKRWHKQKSFSVHRSTKTIFKKQQQQQQHSQNDNNNHNQ